MSTLSYRGDAEHILVDAVQNGRGLHHTHDRVLQENSQLVRGG